MAGALLDDIRADLQKALVNARDDSKLIISGAIIDLVKEFKTGTKSVERAIQAEAMAVRDEFATIVGNAHDAAEDAVGQAKDLVEKAKE
jgi:hypothetical protein